MLFQIKITAEEKILKFGKNSALIEFIIDNKSIKKKLSDVQKETGVKFNDSLITKFLVKENRTLKIFTEKGNPDLIILKKIDFSDNFNTDYFRNEIAGIIQDLEKESISDVHLVVPEYKLFKENFDNENYYLQTFAEGVYLGNYSFDKFKSEKKKKKNLNVHIKYDDKKEVLIVEKKVEKILNSVFFARDLVNEPAIILTPDELAKRVKSELGKIGLKVTVFNKKELIKRKMGAILAVGSGSANEPKMIVMHYKPKGKVKKKIALVGKGVTYDTGGLSIKPTSGMIDMKADMAGAAVVIGSIKTAAEMKLPIEIIGVVPAVENAVSGSSYKPGDVIRTASGKSIEVKNTDAEGRIVLADALEYACKQKPDEIIDFATLTGACVVALGEIAAGIFTKNERMARELLDSGKKTYELTWRLPFWDDYNKLLESDIADVSNLGSKWGGAITAGKFLEHFVDEKIAWTHVDIAGPAIKHEQNNYTKKWNTGFGVRLVIDYLSKI